MPKKIAILFLLGIFLISSGFGCKTTDQKTKQAMTPITINYWRVFDGPDDFDQIIKAYQELHPFVTINYRKLRYAEYENELINALAEDRGPDIFSIHNTWVKKYQNKITPLPPQTTMAYPVLKGSIKKEVVNELQTSNSLTPKDIRDKFVDVVYNDVILEDGQIYGLPLSVDTLAMFYNRDLFNGAGIIEAPVYWNQDFQQNVKKLTKQNTAKELVQSGVALGGGANINRASDILSILMIQNGAVMMENGRVQFNTVPNKPGFKENNYNPGLEALRFYTDFSNPGKEVYSWNEQMPNSLQMFTGGNLAIYFGYSYDLPTIKADAPKLNFSVAKLPQIEGNPQMNFANYWVETVSKKSKYANEAWDFVQFMAREDQVISYLEKTKHPTALKALIPKQREDDEIGVFADQVLTAKSWYRGLNPDIAEKAIIDMISLAAANYDRLINVINEGAARVQQSIN